MLVLPNLTVDALSRHNAHNALPDVADLPSTDGDHFIFTPPVHNDIETASSASSSGTSDSMPGLASPSDTEEETEVWTTLLKCPSKVSLPLLE
mmetsp:Transcript_5486/g.16202  ORF Transcript_5486/g.16202 Transcript_5486/m.16202 type:complete len:93 (-) Transcript_5486:232-510(-)